MDRDVFPLEVGPTIETTFGLVLIRLSLADSVPREGVEPSCREAYDFESYVYTNSTTEASADECSRKMVSYKHLA